MQCLKFPIHGRSFIAILTLVMVLPGCALTRAAYVYAQSLDSLTRTKAVPPIYVEKGAEILADEISAALPITIQHIEASHRGKLGPLPPIVICATQSCYDHYAAIPSAVAETLKDQRISLNGDKILKAKRNAVQLFTHELSHFYWFSKGIIFQPRWFEEGMGVWVSNGGGAENVSVQAAERAIKNGATIQPTLDSGLWNYLTHSPTPPADNWHLYYRQSGMFIQFLHDHDPAAFAHLLYGLNLTKDFQSAWEIAYKKSVDELWLEFIKEIQSKNT